MEKLNDRLEIEGDARQELTEADMDAEYLYWCERHDIVPDLIRVGIGIAPSGDLVQAWQFA